MAAAAGHVFFFTLAITFGVTRFGIAQTTTDVTLNVTTTPTYDDDMYYYSSGGNVDYTYDDEDWTDVNGADDYPEEEGDYYSDPPTYPDGQPDQPIDDDWEGFDGVVCGDGKRVDKSKICDGYRDCFDCSDEENCPGTSFSFFFCYDNSTSPASAFAPYNRTNPRCIALDQFCDGIPDCATGSDELRNGAGFKCVVKDRFRSCILPERLLCDGVPNCEDRSDLCEYDVIQEQPSMKSVHTSSSEEKGMSKKYASVPKGFFQCISAKFGKRQLISQKQLCDGEFNCDDLSDECLCQGHRSEVTRKICNGLCTARLWSNQNENENCRTCAVGEIFWEQGDGMRDDSLQTRQAKSCFSPAEILQILQLRSNDVASTLESPWENKASLTIKADDVTEYEVIECFDQSVSNTIRARKCDGRPECLFGEDECGIDCPNGGDQDWTLGSGGADNNPIDPPVCRLLLSDFSGYSCLSDQGNSSSLKEGGLKSLSQDTHIKVCDGVEDCDDGSDERFCVTWLPCEENVTNSQMYDVVQKCDGFQHCSNGADERPDICAFADETLISCGVERPDEPIQYFTIDQLIDGKADCPSAVDECPPFLSKLPKVLDTFAKSANGTEDASMYFQSGISNHDRAVDNLSLQIFLVASSFIGLSALAVSLVLVLYNMTVAWRRFANSGASSREIWKRNSLTCLRECVVNLNMTLSKALVCSYFAYIKITRSEDTNYSGIDLTWRSSSGCKIIGALCLIGTQVPLFSLAAYVTTYALSLAKCGRERPASRSGNGEGASLEVLDYNGNKEPKTLDARGRACARLLVFVTWILLQTITWTPALVVAGFAAMPSDFYSRTQTYGWVSAEGAPAFLRQKLIDQNLAAEFASTVLTLGRNESQNSSWEAPKALFTFDDFAIVINSSAPNLRVRNLGTYGYFGQSGACLPDFLVHAKGGEAGLDMAVSNTWTWGLSVAILATDLGLILLSAGLTAHFGAAVMNLDCSLLNARKRDSSMTERRRKSYKVLNSTFSAFVLIESLTWMSITILYLAKTISPTSFSGYNYIVWCLTALGLNCGLLTPFLLLKRKFRLEKGRSMRQDTVSRVTSSKRPTRIIEVAGNPATEEQKPLTNGTSPKSGERENGTPGEENQSLVKEQERESSPV